MAHVVLGHTMDLLSVRIEPELVRCMTVIIMERVLHQAYESL